jgi:hypothetical protein
MPHCGAFHHFHPGITGAVEKEIVEHRSPYRQATIAESAVTVIRHEISPQRGAVGRAYHHASQLRGAGVLHGALHSHLVQDA